MESIGNVAPDVIPSWQLISHPSDMGLRGFGSTLAEAFEQAALALTAMMTDLENVEAKEEIQVTCEAPDLELLLMDWLNSIIYQMVTQNKLFSRFSVRVDGLKLQGTLWGENLDVQKHAPAVEPKGVTFAELKVKEIKPAVWMAQCIIDV